MKAGKIAILMTVFMLFGTCGYSDADCITGSRYQAIGDGTVQDCQTGLIWLQNANCSAPLTPLNGITNSGTGLAWKDAMKWVAGLYGDGSGGPNICSLTDGSAAGDWRLPTKAEWMAMVAYAKYTHSPAFTDPALTNDAGTAQWGVSGTSSFTNVQSDTYWSSTTDASHTTAAWDVSMWGGDVDSSYKTSSNNVWPVRGGQSGSFGTLRIE
jgi:hypothetical protein